MAASIDSPSLSDSAQDVLRQLCEQKHLQSPSQDEDGNQIPQVSHDTDGKDDGLALEHLRNNGSTGGSSADTSSPNAGVHEESGGDQDSVLAVVEAKEEQSRKDMPQILKRRRLPWLDDDGNKIQEDSEDAETEVDTEDELEIQRILRARVHENSGGDQDSDPASMEGKVNTTPKAATKGKESPPPAPKKLKIIQDLEAELGMSLSGLYEFAEVDAQDPFKTPPTAVSGSKSSDQRTVLATMVEEQTDEEQTDEEQKDEELKDEEQKGIAKRLTALEKVEVRLRREIVRLHRTKPSPKALWRAAKPRKKRTLQERTNFLIDKFDKYGWMLCATLQDGENRPVPDLNFSGMALEGQVDKLETVRDELWEEKARLVKERAMTIYLSGPDAARFF